MAQILKLHPVNPERRLVNQAVAMMRKGAVIVYPTDSCYALGCQLGDKSAQDRMRRIRRLDDRHDFTLVCRDLSEIAVYAKVDNLAYRMMRHVTPGPYTFILEATRETPRRLQNPRRRSIGIRVPRHPVTSSLLDALGEPIMSCTLLLPDEAEPPADVEAIVARVGHEVELIIDGGACGGEPSTVIDLSGEAPVVVRVGRGPLAPLGLAEPA